MLAVSEKYTRDVAVQALAGAEPTLTLADGQFEILDDYVLCFFETAEHGSQLVGPREFKWVPSRLDYEPEGELPFLPSLVWQVLGHRDAYCCVIKQHHLFVRRSPSAPFVYFGRCYLGRHGDDAGGKFAMFSLGKLPRDLVLEFGASDHWEVEVDHDEPHEVAIGDVPTLRRLLQGLEGQQPAQVAMTRYDGDSLSIHTNATRAWLMFLRYDSSSGLYPDTPNLPDPDRIETFECFCDGAVEFPAKNTVRRADAAAIAEEFFSSGALPASVSWTEDC